MGLDHTVGGGEDNELPPPEYPTGVVDPLPRGPGRPATPETPAAAAALDRPEEEEKPAATGFNELIKGGGEPAISRQKDDIGGRVASGGKGCFG